MNLTGRKKLAAVGPLLPKLVDVARAIHRSELHAKLAVLGAWASLAGVTGWNAPMVEKVEREMGWRK